MINHQHMKPHVCSIINEHKVTVTRERKKKYSALGRIYYTLIFAHSVGRAQVDVTEQTY